MLGYCFCIDHAMRAMVWYRFPALLRALESGKQALGVSSYGLSETTLEEVFLRVNSGGGDKGQQGALVEEEDVGVDVADDEGARLEDGERLTGWSLFG